MNSLLRIRVQVVAKEAQKLADIARGLSAIGSASSASAGKAGAGMRNTLSVATRIAAANRLIDKSSPMKKMAKDAEVAARKIDQVNANLRKMATLSNAKTGGALGTQAGVINRPQVQSAMSRVGIPMSNVKQGQAEQARLAKQAATQQAQAARQAAAAQQAAARQTAATLKSAWKAQTQAAALAAKQQTAAQTAAAKASQAQQVAAAKATQTHLKQVWQQQVQAAKSAAKQQAAAQAQAAKQAQAAAKNAAAQAQLQATQKASHGLRGFYNQLTDGRGFMAFARNLQWTGRQIEYNFTLPLVRAGRAALTMFLENDKAAVKIIKVYGDVGDATTQLVHDTFTLGQTLANVSTASMGEAEQMSYKLGKGLRYLSDIYGIAQSEVNKMAAEWAAAGYEGTALLKATQANIEAVMIGDFESSEDAFQSLIAIIGAYGGSVDDLQQTMANLNAIENDTAASFADLTTAIGRAGSTAARAGVPIEMVAAHVAALVPAGATAATAGNALKTIYSRLLAPTQAAADIFEEIGIQVESSSWKQMDAAERLVHISDKYKELTSVQQAQVDAVVASRYQIDKFGRLITAITNATSPYHDALAAVNDEKATMLQYDKELQTIMESNSKSFEIGKTRIQNMMTDAIVPLIPTIISVVAGFTELLRKFGELDEGTKQAIMFGLVFVALLGPIIRIGAAFGMLAGIVGGFAKIMFGLGKAMIHVWGGVARFMAGFVVKSFQVFAKGVVLAYNMITSAQLRMIATNPWVLLAVAIVAAVAVLYIFRDEIGNFVAEVVGHLDNAWDAFYNLASGIVKTIGGALGALPGMFARAFLAVVRIVAKAAMAVYEMLSYMNPFARHSPSLVEQVTKGVEVIAAKYRSLGNIGTVFRRAAADLAAFSAATEAAAAASGRGERNEQRKSIVSMSPDSAPAVDALYGSLDEMKVQLAAITLELDNQQAVVNELKDAYDAASEAVSKASNELDILKSVQDGLQNRYDNAKAKLQEFTSANIEGMGAAAQATWENEMAQKALRLQILQLERQGGMSFEDIADRIAEMNGEMETLKGTMNDLQGAGAGSEILGPLQAQFDALAGARGALSSSGSPLSALEKQLEDLQYQAEVMDLENALRFDPLTRQIEAFSDEIKEMPFDQIIAGIMASKAEMDAIKPSLDAATAAVDAQQLVVDGLTEARERANAALDIEQERLDELKDAYDAYESQINDIESALSDMAKAAEAAAGAAGGAGGGGGGLSAGDASFDPEAFDPGTSEQLIDDYLKGLGERWQEWWSNFDFKKSIGEAWDKAFAWVKEHTSGIVSWFDRLGDDIWGALTKAWDSTWAFFADPFADLYAAGEAVIMWFEALPGRVIGFIDGLWEDIKFGWWLAVAWIQEKGQIAIDWIADIPNKLSGFVGTLWDSIKTAFNTVKDDVVLKVTNMVETIRGIPGRVAAFVGTLWTSISTKFSETKNTISGYIDGLIELVRGIPGRIAEFAGNIWSDISTKFLTMKGNVSGYIDGMVETIRNLPGRVATAAAGLWDSLKTKFSDMVRGIKNIWNSLRIPPFTIGGWDTPLGKLPSYTTPSINFPDVQDFARGGIIPSGMGGISARMGEKTHDEAIIPLPHGWRNSEALVNNGGGRGDDNRTINFYGDLSFPSVEDGSDAEDFIKNLEVLVGAP